MNETMTVTEALARLDELLPVKTPELAASLNPPATDADLAPLLDVVSPLRVHDDLIKPFRWQNGKDYDEAVGRPKMHVPRCCPSGVNHRPPHGQCGYC